MRSFDSTHMFYFVILCILILIQDKLSGKKEEGNIKINKESIKRLK